MLLQALVKAQSRIRGIKVREAVKVRGGRKINNSNNANMNNTNNNTMKITPIHLNIDYIKNNPNLLGSIIKIQSRIRGISLRRKFKAENNKEIKLAGENNIPNNLKESQNPKIVCIIF